MATGLEIDVALHVVMRKIAQDESGVTYQYGPRGACDGVITLDLQNMEFIEVQPSSGRWPEQDLDNAKKKLARLLAAGGDFPEETFYAA